MQTFQNKTVWIIGASSGIGRALAIELSKAGASLALSARRKEELETLNEELGGGHLVVPLDVSDAESVLKAAADIREKEGRIDIVIFLAAVYTPASIDAIEISGGAQNAVNVNLMGAFHTVCAALPIFHEQKSGQIALCGSVAGYRGLPNAQPYSATKAAIINLAESLRAEQAVNNIDVKIINPGFVRTPLTDKNDFDMPLIIEPEEAARAIHKGLTKKSFEIVFPFGMMIAMKFLQAMPYLLYFPVVEKIMMKAMGKKST